MIALVACSAKKLSAPAPARDLYQGAAFQLGRAIAERHCTSWFILSALHGLLPPDRITAPYNLTLATMKKAEREAWATHVNHQMHTHIRASEPLLVLAGARYASALQDLPNPVNLPLKGLRQGEQLQHLHRLLRTL